MAVVVGTDGPDSMLGGNGPDLFYGYPDTSNPNSDLSNDTLDGAGGDDQLLGGGGDDSLLGGTGYDLLRGHDGNDALNVGADGGRAEGGFGNDRILLGLDGGVAFGDDGNDWIIGGTATLGNGTRGYADDTISGGNNDDLIYG